MTMLVKKCPFCGGKNISFTLDCAGVSVECICGARGPIGIYDAEAQANWNNRSFNLITTEDSIWFDCRIHNERVEEASRKFMKARSGVVARARARVTATVRATRVARARAARAEREAREARDFFLERADKILAGFNFFRSV